jgi:thiamine-monophosphate kinase
MTHPVHEDEVLESIRSMLGNGIEAFGLRDDAAVLYLPDGGPLVASVDSVVEGIHVDLSICSPGDVGWKALMGALSDVAAVGATPLGALVALCLPGGSGDGELALGVMAGVAEAATASGCPVVGGDVSEASALAVAVTVLGSLGPGGRPPVARSGAKPGDLVLLTGPCGASAAGLRLLRAPGGAAVDGDGATRAYQRPVARIREGQLSRGAGAHAMIDVSDGLALDLHRLADASGVGFELTGVPVADGATADEALGGGEDYELVIAVDDAGHHAMAELFSDAGLRAPIPLGILTADPSTRTIGGRPLARLGWQHIVG